MLHELVLLVARNIDVHRISNELNYLPLLLVAEGGEGR